MALKTPTTTLTIPTTTMITTHYVLFFIGSKKNYYYTLGTIGKSAVCTNYVGKRITEGQGGVGSWRIGRAEHRTVF